MSGKYDDWRLDPDAFEASSIKSGGPAGRKYLNVPKEIKFFKPTEDKDEFHSVRFLPFDKETGTFRLPVKVHFNIGGYNAFPCLKSRSSEVSVECPVCVLRRETWRDVVKQSGFDLDDENLELPEVVRKKAKTASDPYKASQYTLTYVIDRVDEKSGPKIWAISGVQTMEKIESLMVNPKSKQLDNIAHPVKGKDVYFKKYSTGKQINGKPVATINDLQLDPEGASPISSNSELMDEWLSFVLENPLEKMLNVSTKEEILKLLGTDSFNFEKDADDGSVQTVKSEGVQEEEISLKDSLVAESSSVEFVGTHPETSVAKTPVTVGSKSGGYTAEDLAAKAAAIRAKLGAK